MENKKRVPKKKRKSSLSKNKENVFDINMFVICIFTFIIIAGYVYFNRSKSATTQNQEIPVIQPQISTDRVRQMYVPDNKGLPTGRKKVFCTTKGLMSLEIDHRGLPIYNILNKRNI